jgi:DNA/RNA endonuclease G (NUC1)
MLNEIRKYDHDGDYRQYGCCNHEADKLPIWPAVHLNGERQAKADNTGNYGA